MLFLIQIYILIKSKNLYSNQFPIVASFIDKKDSIHLKKMQKELNELDKIISQGIGTIIPLFLLNINENVFNSIDRNIRHYVIVINIF